MFVCPSILDTASIETPLAKVVVLACVVFLWKEDKADIDYKESWDIQGYQKKKGK